MLGEDRLAPTPALPREYAGGSAAATGGVADVVFEALDELPVHPEGDGSQALLPGEELGDSGPGNFHDLGEVANECSEEVFAGRGRGAFEDAAQIGILVGGGLPWFIKKLLHAIDSGLPREDRQRRRCRMEQQVVAPANVCSPPARRRL